MNNRNAWKPLPKGSFTGNPWSQPGAIDGQDPYLAWAEADHFAGYAKRHGAKPPKWLPIVIELAAPADVAALVAASNARWLQISQVYLTIPGLRYCSARVKPAFFKQLRQRPAFKALIQRFELGLPVGHHTHPIPFPVEPADALTHKPANPPAQLKGKVLGLIDGGLALANGVFLNAQGRPRVKHFWRQDGAYGGPWPGQGHRGEKPIPLDPRGAGPTPKDLGYGHELSAATLEAAMQRYTPHDGQLDEDALYRHLQLWDLSRPASHGTHVASLAGGRGNRLPPQNDDASLCEIVAVQLDHPAIKDTSGGALNASVLDGLMYILARCAPSSQVVVNISWGTLAGPHDGSSVLEAAMDQLIDLLGGRLQITVPAGNGYQSRTHANATLQPGQACPLHWRVQPDDHTQSFLEIWLPESADGVEISVTPPGSASPLPVMRLGESGLWTGGASGKDAHPLCALIYPQRSALGAQGTCALLALAPTFSLHSHIATAPFGVWQVTLTNTGNQPVTFDVYIERDDVAIGQHTGARQSYFEDAHYDTSGNLDAFVDHANNPTPVRRSGTFNSLSTGQRTVSVGGTRRQADAWSRFARYSPQKPDPDASRPRRPGVKTAPDALQPSDDDPALWGVLGAGSLSGNVVRLAGTSSSAPQQARVLINGF